MTMDELDDEALREKLDGALARAEDAGKAVRTLDAMLGEPQVLIPLADFGEVLYAIIKEDTVVTVLPQSHGEEILHRGRALQDRVASGEIKMPDREDGDRWSEQRRWRRAEPTAPVVVERPRAARPGGPETPGADVIALENKRERPDDHVGAALYDALARGNRRAAVAALQDVLGAHDREAALLPLWNELADQGVPRTLTVGDLIEAVDSLG
jgi:hypothetical protein